MSQGVCVPDQPPRGWKINLCARPTGLPAQHEPRRRRLRTVVARGVALRAVVLGLVLCFAWTGTVAAAESGVPESTVAASVSETVLPYFLGDIVVYTTMSPRKYGRTVSETLAATVDSGTPLSAAATVPVQAKHRTSPSTTARRATPRATTVRSLRRRGSCCAGSPVGRAQRLIFQPRGG